MIIFGKGTNQKHPEQDKAGFAKRKGEEFLAAPFHYWVFIRFNVPSLKYQNKYINQRGAQHFLASSWYAKKHNSAPQ